MHSAKGCIREIYFQEQRAARIGCPAVLVPAPGQYLLATCSSERDSALAYPIFASGVCPGGFYAAAPLPEHWLPGADLNLRGPFGRGFSLPAGARRVALASFGVNCGRLLALLEPALAQGAELVLLSNQPPAGLPARVEISTLVDLPEIIAWADYLAIEIQREQLQPGLVGLAGSLKAGYAQILVDTPLPCAGVAVCGVCAVRTRAGYLLACKDGPVFDVGVLRFNG